MDLRFSPEENAFRQDVRGFFRAEVPETIRKKVSENRHLSKEEMVASHKILHARVRRAALAQGVGAAPTGPRCSTTSTPRSCSSTACRSRCRST